MADNSTPSIDPNFGFLIIGVGSAAFAVAFYHCVVVCWCTRHPTVQTPRQTTHRFVFEDVGTPSSANNSTAQLIPTHQHQKGMGLVGEDATCAVCLSEFEEGEELRILPGCMHSFHVPCIDMWLFSHPSCPICRSDATASTPVLRSATELGSGESEARLGTLQEIVIQSS
jgi:hypothetical protein